MFYVRCQDMLYVTCPQSTYKLYGTKFLRKRLSIMLLRQSKKLAISVVEY
jgi:hypothetical protein